MFRWHGCLRGLGSSLAGSLLLLGGAPAPSGAQARPGTAPDSQTVVFVCEHGTVKSVVALAWFPEGVNTLISPPVDIGVLRSTVENSGRECEPALSGLLTVAAVGG